MARTFSQLKQLINSKLGNVAGTSTESEFLANMNASLDYLRSLVDIPEAEKTQALSPALFTDVVLYTPPTDLYGDSILDIRPLVELPYQRINNQQQRMTPTEFNNNLIGDHHDRKWAIEYNQGDKYFRILNSLEGRTLNIMVNNCDSYNGNGTWTADTSGSDANTVATDNVNYFEGSGSVSFNITVGQSVNNYATIYNPSLNATDISNTNDPYLLFYVYLPSITNFTSVTMYAGSDTSATPSTKANYYAFTATTQFDGSAFVVGRNLIGVKRSLATETGSVNDAAISYLELRLSYAGTYTSQTGVLLDAVIFREGQIYEIRYFTNSMVESAAGVAKQYFTADDDITIWNPDTELLYMDIAAGYLAPNTGDFMTGKNFREVAMESVMRYKSRYPQERKLLSKNWFY